MDSTSRVWVVVIVCATLVLLGVTGCQMNQDRQFRLGGYCQAQHGGSSGSAWIRCDLLKGFNGLP